MPVDRDAPIRVLDLARGEIKHIDVGNAARAIDDAFGFGRMLGALVGEVNAQASVRLFDSPDAGGGSDPDADPLALGLQVRDRIDVGNSCGSASRIVTLLPARA